MPILHRQYPDFSQPTNSCNFNSETHPEAFYPRPATAVDFTSASSSSLSAPKSQFMSDPLFNYPTQQFEPQQYSSVVPQSYAPFYPQSQQQSQQQPQSQASREWQMLGGNYYNNPDFMNQQTTSSREQSSQGFRSTTHQRALSNSTVASQLSGPTYSHTFSAQGEGLFSEQQEYAQTPSRSAKHLPTPSHTPTQDAYMEQMYGRNKANSSSYPDTAPQRQLRQEFSSASAQGYPAGPEFPATPRTSNGDESEEQYSFQVPGEIYSSPDESDFILHADGSYFDDHLAIRQVPKFDRTMSDIYQDELYNPTTVPSAPVPIPQHQNTTLLSPYRNVVMNERLQAANLARSTSTSPVDQSRDISPFRQTSPYAGSVTQFTQGSGRIGTVAELRSRQKAEADERAYRDHHPLPNASVEQKTISPKDAILEYPDVDDANSSLFPRPQSSGQGSQRSYAPLVDNRQQMPATYSVPSSTFNFVQPTVPASASFTGVNETPKFGSNLFRPTSNTSSLQDSNPEYPAHLVSMETSASESADPSNTSPRGNSRDDDEDDGDDEDDDETEVSRPDRSTADTGTYTCTYHGCAQRFESPAKLQKHKREGHRSHQGGSISAASSSSPAAAAGNNSSGSRHGSVDRGSTPSGMTSAALLRNSQAGPHRCDRINPSTGKPCNTIFSRPYDLTRHEDTIHNSQKKKVRCGLCTEEKTFSRSDALTRHMRVVHPEVDFPGKHKRRGGE